MYASTVTEQSCTIFKDGKVHSVNSSHKNFEQIKELTLQAKYEEAIEIINFVPERIIQFGANIISFDIMDRPVLDIHGKRVSVDQSLLKRIIERKQKDFNVQSLYAFLMNLLLNPSARSVNELYRFLEYNDLPITEDGYFLAFKKVRKDFKDIHSGTIDNSVGQIVQMPRNQVNDNSYETCSFGLHFCSKEYLNSFGDKDDPIVVLKIHPKDVVSIPVDYNNSKGRCCQYEVIAVLNEETPEEELHSVLPKQEVYPSKVCKTCLKSKPFGDFRKSGIKRGQQTFRSICKECERKQ